MTKSQLFQFIHFLKKNNFQVLGPVYISEDGRVVLKELQKPEEDLDFTGRPPYYSFKEIIFPAKQTLFKYQGTELTSIIDSFRKIAILMMNFLDLRALGLYDKIYENDIYYRTLRNQILIIGTNLFDDKPENNHWGFKYSRDFLTHCPFDIFLEIADFRNEKNNYDGNFNVLTGSLKGKEILRQAQIEPEYHLDYVGPQMWGVIREKMNKFKERMEHYDESIWRWLGERCIECGQCTIVCPTCFCFDINDKPLGKNEGVRERCWTSCFYANFSEVGAPAKIGTISEGFEFLNTTAKKIHFWYFHKFGRIPKDYNIEGCVGCGRCTRACPVDISLPDTMKLVEGCQGSAALMKVKSKAIAAKTSDAIMKAPPKNIKKK